MKEQQTNEREVIEVEYIDQDNYKEYIGKTVKVNGYVNLSNLGLTEIPINFTEVGGNFYCHENKLIDLEGAPEKVGGDFYCTWNKLTTLEGCPKEVGGSFYCSWNQLTSLEDSPKEVGGFFDCSYNPLKSFEGRPEFIGGEFISSLM